MEHIELVNGIECLIREDENVIEYTPRQGVFWISPTIVAAAGEIPEDKKLTMENVLTFTFPSVSMKFPKNVTALETMAASYNQTWQDFDTYFDEALNKALHSTPQSLGSSSSVMRPCIQVCMVPTNGTRPLLHAMLYHQIARAAEHHYKGPAPMED